MQAKPRSTQQRLDTAVLTDARDFAALEEEWAELYEACPSATPFQSWAWLYSWWEVYGEGHHRLRLVTVREVEGGELVGVAPFMIERTCGPGRLLFAANKFAMYTDIVVKKGSEQRVAQEIARSVKKLNSWLVADLTNLTPRAIVWSVFQEWSAGQASGPKDWFSDYLAIDAKAWDEVLQGMSKNFRKSARRSIRRVEEDGVSRKLAGPEEAEEAARRLVALHREMWRGRDIDPEHLTERYESWVASTARRMTAQGLGAISEFWCDGEVIIADLLVFGRDFVGAYLAAANQEALKRYQWSTLYIWDGMDVARSKNKLCLSLMGGQFSYKLRWNPRVEPNCRVVLGREPVLWRLYAGYHFLWVKAGRYLASEDSPGWVREAALRYRRLLYRIARFGKLRNHPRWVRNVIGR